MKMYTYFLCTAMLAISQSSCKKREASQPIESIDFQKNFSISSEFIDATSKLEITIHLSDSLHAYAPGEKVGKPVALEISDKNSWKADGPAIIPPGKKVKLDQLGESMVLQGEVQLSQKLKRGTGQGEALLHLQVCTNAVCDRPRIHKLPLISGQP